MDKKNDKEQRRAYGNIEMIGGMLVDEYGTAQAPGPQERAIRLAHECDGMDDTDDMDGMDGYYDDKGSWHDYDCIYCEDEDDTPAFTSEEWAIVEAERQERRAAFRRAEAEERLRQWRDKGETLFADYDTPTDLFVSALSGTIRHDTDDADDDYDSVYGESSVPEYIKGKTLCLSYLEGVYSGRNGDNYYVFVDGEEAGSFIVEEGSVSVVPADECRNSQGVVVKAFTGRVTIAHTRWGRVEIIGVGTPTFVVRYEKDAEREGGRL